MEFQLNPYHLNVSDEELLDDLKRVHNELKDEVMSRDKYDEIGKYSYKTIQKRFGGWNNALTKAGLKILVESYVSDVELFKNIEELWIKLGKQPSYRDIDQSFSKYSTGPYRRRFGTLRKALEAFILYIKSGKEVKKQIEIFEENIPIQQKEFVFKHKTKRQISDRLKVQVLHRDGNKCRLCGIIVTGNSIHYDHIKPWSKGGETVLENIQVLCAKHNIAKGNLDFSVSQSKNIEFAKAKAMAMKMRIRNLK